MSFPSIINTMSVADYYQAGYLTEDQTAQAQLAVNYIWEALPQNAKALLLVKGGGATGANALGLLEAMEDDKLLNEAKVPVAQINVGYLSNETECDLLNEEEYKMMIADGIYDAITGIYEENLNND